MKFQHEVNKKGSKDKSSITIYN